MKRFLSRLGIFFRLKAQEIWEIRMVIAIILVYNAMIFVCYFFNFLAMVVLMVFATSLVGCSIYLLIKWLYQNWIDAGRILDLKERMEQDA